MKGLQNKVAVVMGAGRGIGAATARYLAQEQVRVVVADIDGDAGQRVAGDIMQAGGEAASMVVDVRSDESVAQLMDDTVRRFGGIDLLHNNVASPTRNAEGDGDATTISLDAWDAALEINVRGMLLGCRHAIPYMLERGGGAIVNTSSGVAMKGEAGRVAYNTSKAAVLGLTRHVAVRWGKQGIRCNAVAPGVTLTEVAKEVLSADVREEMLQRLPATRLAEPADIAAIVAFLMSDDSAYIQGEVIVADGGASITSR